MKGNIQRGERSHTQTAARTPHTHKLNFAHILYQTVCVKKIDDFYKLCYFKLTTLN